MWFRRSICDSVASAGKGDFVIINGGSVRNNLKKGNITKGGIIEALPWFNNIVIKDKRFTRTSCIRCFGIWCKIILKLMVVLFKYHLD